MQPTHARPKVPRAPRLGACVVLPALFMPGLSLSARAETLTDLWNAARRDGTYRKPDPEEVRAAEDLFRRTFAAKEDVPTLQAAWRRLHFELLPFEKEGAAWLVLREWPGHKTGRGFYVFRTGPAPAVVVQAPHGWSDLHTGRIALRLLEEHALRAGAWNTISRADGDLAHLPVSHFQAFTQAFAHVSRQGLVVQLHGFEPGKRKSQVGEEAEVVASNGTRRPPGWLLGLAKAWKEKLSLTVRVYPHEVGELGGSTNAQAQLLQGLGHDGFLHVELSLALRQRLRDEERLRAAFFKEVLTIYRRERDSAGQ